MKSGVTFAQWLVLETLDELIAESSDAVSQVAVARRAGLTERVVSYWMDIMTELGIVDRGPSADGRAWRVLLTNVGKKTLQTCNERLEAAGLTG